MAEDDKESRTETASDKKRGDTKAKGRTIHSKEVNSTFILLAALIFLYSTGGWMREQMLELMANGFRTSGTYEVDASTMRPLMIYYFKMMMRILGPVVVPILIAGVASNLMQNGGWILTAEPLKPTFGKMNPIKGFGRIFSRQAVVELFKSLAKISVVAYICYWVVAGEWEKIPSLSDQNVEQIIWFLTWVAIKLIFYVLLLMVVLATIDFSFQKYMFEESIKMTKQEVKDERKDVDGDPLVKQRIRSAQMQIARRRMMADVPKADVVITNPTHLAVALLYNRSTMVSPTVVAKGGGAVAKKIREVAKEHNVPIVEDKPLARILFKTINIGQSIPEELFRAIAEILAYVYRLKGKII